jgi:hypothetical protein
MKDYGNIHIFELIMKAVALDAVVYSIDFPN